MIKFCPDLWSVVTLLTILPACQPAAPVRMETPPSMEPAPAMTEIKRTPPEAATSTVARPSVTPPAAEPATPTPAENPNLSRITPENAARVVQVGRLGRGLVLGPPVFSPDGQLLATGSYGRTVRLWRAEDGSPLAGLNGHSDYLTDLAFSPSGELLASASNDGALILWGLPPP